MSVDEKLMNSELLEAEIKFLCNSTLSLFWVSRALDGRKIVVFNVRGPDGGITVCYVSYLIREVDNKKFSYSFYVLPGKEFKCLEIAIERFNIECIEIDPEIDALGLPK